MSAVGLTPVQAGRIVNARLGRPPQDMLEAAVALEAWAGVPAADALPLARRLMSSSQSARAQSVGPLPKELDPREGLVAEAVAFVVSVVAVACWAQPLSSALGTRTVEMALALALPLTLGLQWALRGRFLSRPNGLALAAEHPGLLVLLAVASVVAPTLALGESGLLGGLLTLVWVGGTFLIRRRWTPVYPAIVLAATVAMAAGPPAPEVVAAAALATIVLVAAALATSRTHSTLPPGRWSRSAAAGLIGAGLGGVLVADPTIGWGMHGAAPAIALLPSTIASFWGGYRLWRFHHVIPRSLLGVALVARNQRALARPAWRLLIGTIGRIAGLCAALSLVVVLGPQAFPGLPPVAVSVLGAFGLVALATLLISLLEAVGRVFWALAAVAAALATEIAMRLLAAGAFSHLPGFDLIVAASLAIVIALPPSVALLRRPVLTLATVLWIP